MGILTSIRRNHGQASLKVPRAACLVEAR